MRTFLLILPALTLTLLCSGQSADPLITFRQNLRQDLPLFSKIITRLHPLYNKPGIRDQISTKLDSLYKLNTPLTMGQVGSAIQAANTGGQCTDAHSFFSMTMPDMKVWPYATRVIGDRIYINQDSVTIPFGAEITTINGRPVRQLFDRLRSRDQKTGSDTTVDFSDMETSWSAIWSEEFGPQEAFDVDYKYQDKDGHAHIDAISAAAYFTSVYPKRVTPSDEWKHNYAAPIISYWIKKADHAAYLCLNTFSLSQDSLKAYMDSLFGQLRRDSISGLLIDLTHNGGGAMNNVPLFYSYLTDKPFDFSMTYTIDDMTIPFREYLTAIGQTPVKGHTKGEIDTAEISMREGFRKTASGKYEQKVFQTPYAPAAPDKRYGGYIFIFISGETQSAACAFSALAKINRRAALIGSPSGGKAHFIDAGIQLQYRLPNSGIEFSAPICHMNLDFANKLPEDKCAPLQPDLSVSNAEILQMFLNRNGNLPAYNKLRQYMDKR